LALSCRGEYTRPKKGEETVKPVWKRVGKGTLVSACAALVALPNDNMDLAVGSLQTASGGVVYNACHTVYHGVTWRGGLGDAYNDIQE
jgi:hypothetical protein